jgi:hypothetical protein
MLSPGDLQTTTEISHVKAFFRLNIGVSCLMLYFDKNVMLIGQQ